MKKSCCAKVFYGAILEAQQLLESEVKDQTPLEIIDGWLAKTGGYAKDMMLRDAMAIAAMQGMVSRFEANEGLLAAISYKVADAMLKARAV